MKCSMLETRAGRGRVWCVGSKKEHTFQLPRDIPYSTNFDDWFIADDSPAPTTQTRSRRTEIGGSSGTAGDAREEDDTPLSGPHFEHAYQQPPEYDAYNPWESQQPQQPWQPWPQQTYQQPWLQQQFSDINTTLAQILEEQQAMRRDFSDFTSHFPYPPPQ